VEEAGAEAWHDRIETHETWLRLVYLTRQIVREKVEGRNVLYKTNQNLIMTNTNILTLI
jgi:hypothetical protein